MFASHVIFNLFGDVLILRPWHMFLFQTCVHTALDDTISKSSGQHRMLAYNHV